jgi:FkbM family methyltransferase
MLGRPQLQALFEALHGFALAGLGFGEGNDPRLSGERSVMRLLARRAEQHQGTPLIFDVGANTGSYTRALLDAFGDTAEIWAFEPAPSTFRRLESAVAASHRVRLWNLGFSDAEGTGTLYSPAEGSKLGSVYDTTERQRGMGLPALREDTIQLTTLDRFCRSHGVERVHFLKLDVEGHELQILRGARGLLAAGRISAIQFEFGVANLESRTYFRDFFQLLRGSYTVHRVLKRGLCPVDAYRETHEVFKRATNYLALARTD